MLSSMPSGGAISTLPSRVRQRALGGSSHEPRSLHFTVIIKTARRYCLYALALCGACGFLAGCGAGGSGLPSAQASLSQGASSSPVSEPGAPFRFFSTSSIWNTTVGGTTVDPQSTQFVSALGQTVASEGGAGINTTRYSVPVYTVRAHQRTVTIQLVHHRRDAALSRAWEAVPLPAHAMPSVGTDGELVVWQPSTDRLWEFWRLGHEGRAGGWSAWWGGAMRHVSSSTGVYGSRSWPGGQSSWGAAATSLSLVGGLISLEDLKHGVINHAVSMSVPNVRAGEYAAPARRTDGISAEPFALPEGAHLRLDPTLNLQALHLPRVTLMIAEAAQRYGIIINNKAKAVTFQAQDPEPTGTEPYGGPSGYFEGKTPIQLLASFPWEHLELLTMELRSSRRVRGAAFGG